MITRKKKQLTSDHLSGVSPIFIQIEILTKIEPKELWCPFENNVSHCCRTWRTVWRLFVLDIGSIGHVWTTGKIYGLVLSFLIYRLRQIRDRFYVVGKKNRENQNSRVKQRVGIVKKKIAELLPIIR